MTNTVLLAVIAVANCLTPVFWIVLNKNMRRLEQNTNSKMDKLLDVTGAAEHAKGVLQGKAEEHVEGKKIETIVAEKITTGAIEVKK